MSEPLRIAVAQRLFRVGDVDGNAGIIIEEAARARDALGAQLVVFPDCLLYTSDAADE